MEKHYCKSVINMQQQGLKRKLHTFKTGNETSVKVNEANLLLFSSNNYLGLATDKRLKEKAALAIERYGTGAGGARLVTGNCLIHEQLEAEIADWQEYESALIFSSGYLANIGVISSIVHTGDVIFSDSQNHASIIDGCRLSGAKVVVYQHVDMNDLVSKLKNTQVDGNKLIVTNGVFSMEGRIAPLPKLVALAEAYDAQIVVDDAHGCGILGNEGQGAVAHYNLQGSVDFSVGTLSKAIGSEGGFVAASKNAIEYLQHHARPFIYQTALSPANVAAAMEGIRIIREEPARRDTLMQHVLWLANELKGAGLTVTYEQTAILSLLIGDSRLATKYAEKLYEAGFYIPAIRPPTVPHGTSRLRITLMATHTAQEITQLRNALIEIAKELNK